MLYLKQSTASQSVLIGPFVDSTDGATAETGLSIANTDIRLSKNGGNLGAKNSGGGTHDEAGWYTITLDATDTDTVGRLQLHCKMSGALMVHHEYQVLEENVFDAWFAASAAAGTDLAAILTDTADMQPKLGTITDLGGGATLGANNADLAGATFSSSTDSQEAIRDRGDSAWTTGAGGSDRLLMVDTTIATLATQTSFTLTAGSADDDAYNNCTIVVEDVSTSTQKAVGMVIDYAGSTKTVTLKEALAFTIATTDKVYILAENSLKSTVANRQLDGPSRACRCWWSPCRTG